MFDRTAIAWAICRAATPENLLELSAYGNAGPIADAVIAAIHESMQVSGVANQPLNAATLTPSAAVQTAPVVGDDFDARLSALCDEEWRFHSGPPPEHDSPLSQVYDAGIGYAWARLAELLEVDDYEGGDGSEDYATDVMNTGRNILVAAGYANADGDLLTAADLLAPHPVEEAGQTGEVIKAASFALMYLQTGFIECEQCGHEMPTKDLDATYTLADVVPFAALTSLSENGGDV